MAATALVGVGLAMQQASAAEYDAVFYVNSTAGTGGTCVAGNDVPTGSCTLLAALTQSNALGNSNAVLVTVATGFSGTIALPSSLTGFMKTSGAVSSFDSGAYYVISAPTTVDLQNALTVNSGTSDTSSTVFYIDTPGTVTLKNLKDVWTGGGSITASPRVDGLTIDGGSTVNSASYVPERFLTIVAGAKNVTFKNYSVRGFVNFWNDQNNTAPQSAFVLLNGNSTSAIDSVTVDNVTVDNPIGGGCSGSDGSGCNTHGVAASGLVSNLTISNSTFQNVNRGTQNHQSEAINLFAATVTTVRIVDNKFLNNNTAGYSDVYGLVNMPYSKTMSGTNVISGNVFDNTGLPNVSAQRAAIYGRGASTANGNSTSSNLSVTNNTFDGFGNTASAATVRFYQYGIVTARQNTFGPQSGSQATTANEETASTTTQMYSNNGAATNQGINTWYPTALSEAGPACAAQLTLAAPTAPVPQTPVDVDVYWTATTKAEVYVGSYSGVTGSTFTIDDVELPAEAVTSGSGTLTGYLRVQTQVPTASSGFGQVESSQYSRTVALSGSCQPYIAVAQAESYGDTATQDNVGTYTRAVEFTVTSSLPLQAVTSGMLSLTGSTAAGARITDVTCDATNETCTVTVLANDTGLLVLSMPAGVATSTTGVVNRASTTGDSPDANNSVKFLNPLSIAPQSLEVTAGLVGSVVNTSAGYERQYTVTVAAGAPAPTGAIAIAATPADAGLGLSLTPLSVAAGQRSGSTTVTATNIDPDQVPDGSTTTVSYTVTSADPQYDGLLLPSTSVKILQLKPGITVVKRAWIDVPEGSRDSAADIMANGTEIATGGTLVDNTPVWWTYTVTNTGVGGVSDFTVKDSVLGNVCTVAHIDEGATASCFKAGTVTAQ